MLADTGGPAAGRAPAPELLAGADPELAAAVRARPDDGDAWFQLGNYYVDQDQLLEAEQAYQEALRAGPNVKAQHNLGLVQIRLGIDSLRRASEALPEDDPVRQQTRQFLQLLAEAGYQ